jgi:hypothetical protein
VTGPTIERVPVPDIEAALRDLDWHWRLPDGHELVGARDVARVRREILGGYYYRLVFPTTWTRTECVEWCEVVQLARELGLL